MSVVEVARPVGATRARGEPQTMPMFQLPEQVRRELARQVPDAAGALREPDDPAALTLVAPVVPAWVRPDRALPAGPPPLPRVQPAPPRRPTPTRAAPAEDPDGAPSVSDPAHELRASRRRPESAMFRYEALRAYAAGAKLSSTLQVVPASTRVLLAILAATVLATLVVAGVGKVDLNATGRGTMRAPTGVQALVFPIDGLVRDVLVRDGELVEAGALLIRLDSTQLSAALQEAEEHLLAVRQRAQHDERLAVRAHERDQLALQRRGVLLRARSASQGRSLRALDRERVQLGALAAQGYLAEQTRRDSEQQLLHERRDLLSTEDELALLGQQQAVLEQNRQAAIAAREQLLSDATTRRDAAARMLAQTELRAARAGRVESLTVSEGELVAAQRAVARLVPREAGRRITAFLPERERAFVRAGVPVRVEFDQLPAGEFGSMGARVLRVSSEVASRAELESALGAAAQDGVWFSVALELLDGPRARSLLPLLGSGSLVTVRLPVRRRHILSLIFDPVRKWLD